MMGVVAALQDGRLMTVANTYTCFGVKSYGLWESFYFPFPSL